MTLTDSKKINYEITRKLKNEISGKFVVKPERYSSVSEQNNRRMIAVTFLTSYYADKDDNLELSVKFDYNKKHNKKYEDIYKKHAGKNYDRD